MINSDLFALQYNLGVTTYLAKCQCRAQIHGLTGKSSLIYNNISGHFGLPMASDDYPKQHELMTHRHFISNKIAHLSTMNNSMFILNTIILVK